MLRKPPTNYKKFLEYRYYNFHSSHKFDGKGSSEANFENRIVGIKIKSLHMRR